MVAQIKQDVGEGKSHQQSRKISAIGSEPRSMAFTEATVPGLKIGEACLVMCAEPFAQASHNGCLGKG